jgi:hypothetical protein
MTQPDPIPTDEPDLWLQVIGREKRKAMTLRRQSLVSAMHARRKVGIERYGTPLQASNGRDASADLDDELLDGVVYAEQEMERHAGNVRAVTVYGAIQERLIDAWMLHHEFLETP